MAITIPVGISDKLFRKISRFVTEETGIQLPDSKKSMLEARLRKRMRLLNLETFENYADYVFSDEGKRLELISMIDSITTNKTSFFREADHFDVLTRTVLPDLLARKTNARP
nr:chemotaxis protein CheR [Calditrichia bacterium]